MVAHTCDSRTWEVGGSVQGLLLHRNSYKMLRFLGSVSLRIHSEICLGWFLFYSCPHVLFIPLQLMLIFEMMIKDVCACETDSNRQKCSKKQPVTNPWSYHLVFQYLFSKFPFTVQKFPQRWKILHILAYYTSCCIGCLSLACHRALDVYESPWTSLLDITAGLPTVPAEWILCHLPKQWPEGGCQLVCSWA